MPSPGQTLKARVKLGKSPADCWTFLGPVTNTGHGKVTFCGRECMAHRWLWEQLFGPIPKGWVVYSTCDRKDCINPHHLACGTIAEANRQSISTKLLPADVAEIRATEPSANAARALSERMGVSVNLIRDIWGNRAWRRPRGFHGPKRPRNQHSEAA